MLLNCVELSYLSICLFLKCRICQITFCQIVAFVKWYFVEFELVEMSYLKLSPWRTDFWAANCRCWIVICSVVLFPNNTYISHFCLDSIDTAKDYLFLTITTSRAIQDELWKDLFEMLLNLTGDENMWDIKDNQGKTIFGE